MNLAMSTLNFFNPFLKPTAAQVAKDMLEDYERQLIVTESAAAYQRKMSEYYREGITRLRSQQTAGI